MKLPFQNRSSLKPVGRVLPTRFRFTKHGVLIFTPTLADRAKIALGYNIKVSVTQRLLRA